LVRSACHATQALADPLLWQHSVDSAMETVQCNSMLNGGSRDGALRHLVRSLYVQVCIQVLTRGGHSVAIAAFAPCWVITLKTTLLMVAADV
jgi:hypothetical protein